MQNIMDALNRAIDFTLKDNYTNYNFSFDVWDWSEGVGMYALMRAYDKLGDEKIVKFVKRYVDHHFKKGLCDRTVNGTAPFNAILDLYKLYGNLEYRSQCEEQARFVMAQARRADEGMFEHTMHGDTYAGQVWADTLFMCAIFLARYGQFTGNEMYLREAARQLILHYKYLINQETGLMFHGYNCKTRSNMSAVHWGRANGWAVVSSIEILDLLPSYFKEREKIIENLNAHLSAIARYADNGRWHTVLDHPETYLETTAGACFCFGMTAGVKRGYIKDDYAMLSEQALAALIDHIDPSGEVTEGSGGTPIQDSVAGYNEIEFEKTFWAQGLTILALLENL